ncbi:MAG: hypothetical protein Q9225_003982 [Loekoesia sp. 1 TL-2023]
MSENPKSMPSYWCKYCKSYVRNTELEKTKHESTAKHQGNIKRYLRDLHRGHEREERDKDRAKSEVERLNAVVSGASSGTKPTAIPRGPNAALSGSTGREATPAERKAQLTKLAEMGVAVPEDYRREVAMAGDWQTVAERPIWNHVKKEEGPDDFKDFKPDPTLNVGIRKRKLEGQEEEEDGSATVRKGWGSTVRRYPGSASDGDDDLDALLNKEPKFQQKKKTQAEDVLLHPTRPEGRHDESRHGAHENGAIESGPKPPSVKKEDSEGFDIDSLPNQSIPPAAVVKQEDEDTQPTIAFKKRKAKTLKSS